MCIKTPIQISQFSNALKGTNESGRKKCLGRTMLNGICLRSKHSHNYLTSLYHFGKKKSFILLWFYCQHYSTYMYLNKTEQILNYNSLLKVLKITSLKDRFQAQNSYVSEMRWKLARCSVTLGINTKSYSVAPFYLTVANSYTH